MEISLKGRVWHQACSVILKKKRKINWDIEGKWLNVLPNSDFCNCIRYAVQGMFCFLLEPDFFETVPLSQKVIKTFPVDLCSVSPFHSLPCNNLLSSLYILWIFAMFPHPATPSSSPLLFQISVSGCIPMAGSKLWSFWPSTIDNCWDHTVAFPWVRNH